MHSFEVQSNESACRKKVHRGMEQVLYLLLLIISVLNTTHSCDIIRQP